MLRPLRGLRDLRSAPLHTSPWLRTSAAQKTFPGSGCASTAKRADGYAGFVIPLHPGVRSIPNPAIRHAGKRERSFRSVPELQRHFTHAPADALVQLPRCGSAPCSQGDFARSVPWLHAAYPPFPITFRPQKAFPVPAPPSQRRKRHCLHAASQRTRPATSAGRNCSASHPSGCRSGHCVACATSGLLRSTLSPGSAHRQHRKQSERAPFASLHAHPRIAHIKKPNRITHKTKKDCQGSPRSVPCKGPAALRVRPAKISTAGKDEPLPHLPQEGGGNIFTGNVLLERNPTVSRIILYAPVFVPLHQATNKPCV